MIEQLIAEATECDFKVALETKKPYYCRLIPSNEVYGTSW